MPRMKESARKRKEDVLARGGTTRFMSDSGAGGSGRGRNLRPRASKKRAEVDVDIGGDTWTSSNDDVEDETFVDYSAFELRKRHGKGQLEMMGIVPKMMVVMMRKKMT